MPLNHEARTAVETHKRGSEAGLGCDVGADSDCDLDDFWAFQTCFDSSPVCGWADVDTDDDVDLDDYEVLWSCPSPPAVLCSDGDYNGDGFVDGDDQEAFGSCYTGPGVPISPEDEERCGMFDLDCDGDIDYRDYAILLELLYHPVGQPVHLCRLTEADTSLLGNPYYFTGRRLDVILDLPPLVISLSMLVPEQARAGSCSRAGGPVRRARLDRVERLTQKASLPGECCRLFNHSIPRLEGLFFGVRPTALAYSGASVRALVRMARCLLQGSHGPGLRLVRVRGCRAMPRTGGMGLLDRTHLPCLRSLDRCWNSTCRESKIAAMRGGCSVSAGICGSARGAWQTPCDVVSWCLLSRHRSRPDTPTRFGECLGVGPEGQL
jgi:hypothetical protein